MTGKNKFGSAEAVILLAMTMAARIFLSFPAALMEGANNAAWMTPIGGILVALGGVFIMGKLLKQSPEKNIIQITEDTLGAYIGTAVNLVYVIFFLSIATIFVREFSEKMITVALPSTPISIITTGYLIVCLLGAHLGLEVLARAASLTYPFAAIGVIILLVTLYPAWEFNNIYPLFGGGFYHVFVAGTYKTAAVSEIILVGLIVQSVGGYKQIFSIGFKAVLLSFSLLIIMLFVMNLTHNWRIAKEFAFPFYRLAKTIYLGVFFQRVEAVYIVIWSFIGILKIGITLYGAAFSLAESLKLPDYRPLLWPLTMLIFTGSLLPNDMPTAIYLDSNYLRPGAWIPNYIIPLFLLLVIRFKGTSKNAK